MSTAEKWAELRTRIAAAKTFAAKKFNTVNGLRKNTRMEITRPVEVGTLEVLTADGTPFYKTGTDADKQGTDFQCKFAGEKLRGQLKWRTEEDKADILVDVYEPWYGPDNYRDGRDQRGGHDFYVTLTKDKLIYVCWTKALKPIAMDAIELWKKAGHPRTFNAPGGVQIKITTDKESHVPKVLAFIPPRLMVEQGSGFLFEETTAENFRSLFGRNVQQWIAKYGK